MGDGNGNGNGNGNHQKVVFATSSQIQNVDSSDFFFPRSTSLASGNIFLFFLFFVCGFKTQPSL